MNEARDGSGTATVADRIYVSGEYNAAGQYAQRAKDTNGLGFARKKHFLCFFDR